MSNGDVYAGQAAAERSVRAEPDFLRIRRELDDVATDLTGLSCDVRVSVTAFRPFTWEDGTPGIDQISAQGMLGMVRRAGHVPLVHITGITRSGTGVQHCRVDGTPLESLEAPLFMEGFGLTAPDRIRRTAQGQYHICEMEFDGEEAVGSDYMVLTRLRLKRPDFRSQDAIQVAISNRAPGRLLIMDTLLHRDLTLTGRAFAGLYYPGIRDVAPSLHARWFDYLGALPTPVLLGDGITGIGHAAMPSHADVVSSILDRAGWDPGEFRLYRLEIPVPAWAMDHLIHFEGQAEAASRAGA